MKNIFILLFLFFAIQLSAQNIIPQPVMMTPKSGEFRLSSKMAVSYNHIAAQKVADLFIEKVAKASGISLKSQLNGKIRFTINTIEDPLLGNEGYHLEVSNSEINLNANKEAGLFYGLQTLYQLLPKEIESQSVMVANWVIPAVSITDYPRFAWRGLMFDVSRHFFGKEDIKRYIDNMVRYKYNSFHWHLTDDEGWRIEIKSLPKLTEIGACRAQRYGKFGNHKAPQAGEKMSDCGFYTQEEIKEIIAYAAERHVTIVPEIDVPGHSMAAIASYPDLCCTKDTSIKVSVGQRFSEWYDDGTFKMLIDNTLNPSDEKVYDFLDKVFTEVAALFPSPYIHTGGDECYHGYWEKNIDCQSLMKKEGLKNTLELQGYFLKRVEKIIASKGKKLIGWDEILDGGLTTNSAVMSWRGTKGGIEATKLGHQVVLSPNDFLYIDLIQGDKLAEPDATAYKTVRLKKCYDYEPISEGINSKFILGGQANLWTEKVPTIRHAEYMTFPRAWAVADIFWSTKESKNWENFVSRMETQFERADVSGINYAKSAYDAIPTPTFDNQQLTTELSTEIKGLDIYYTLDETTPDLYAKKYKSPIIVPEGNDVTLRVITYRGNKQVGKIINFPREVLMKRVKK